MSYLGNVRKYKSNEIHQKASRFEKKNVRKTN